MKASLLQLGIQKLNQGAFCGEWRAGGPVSERVSPIDGLVIGRVQTAAAADYDHAVDRAREAFLKWRSTPAPVRGETIRRFGVALRERKLDLAKLVTLETGKILVEADGEVQEMIDICDFAVGLSRQLHGLTIASERPKHRLMEQWHPLGVVGVITAFNFPVAVWAWNSALAAVGGNNAVIVMPSADLDLAARAIFFGAVGTAGQRCTTTRRVIAHESVQGALKAKLQAAYRSIRIGNPLDRTTLMGPLIDPHAVK